MAFGKFALSIFRTKHFLVSFQIIEISAWRTLSKTSGISCVIGERFARIHQVTRVLQDGHTMESIERALKAYKERLSDIEILCFHQVSRDETIFDRVNETYHTLSNYPTLLSSCPLYLVSLYLLVFYLQD